MIATTLEARQRPVSERWHVCASLYRPQRPRASYPPPRPATAGSAGHG